MGGSRNGHGSGAAKRLNQTSDVGREIGKNVLRHSPFTALIGEWMRHVDVVSCLHKPNIAVIQFLPGVTVSVRKRFRFF